MYAPSVLPSCLLLARPISPPPQRPAEPFAPRQATFASEVKVTDDTATVTREVDGGLQTLALPLPAVVTADLRLNTPRFATLPNIMKAKRKKVDALTPADLGLGGSTDLAGGVELLSVAEPPKRVGGGVSDTVEEMLDKMKAGGVAL